MAFFLDLLNDYEKKAASNTSTTPLQIWRLRQEGVIPARWKTLFKALGDNRWEWPPVRSLVLPFNDPGIVRSLLKFLQL